MNQIKIFQIWPPESNVSVFLDCWRRDLGQTLIQSDRKSTRLNSSHGYISYAVFCLKKKKQHYAHTNLALSREVRYSSNNSGVLSRSREAKRTDTMLCSQVSWHGSFM